MIGLVCGGAPASKLRTLVKWAEIFGSRVVNDHLLTLRWMCQPRQDLARNLCFPRVFSSSESRSDQIQPWLFTVRRGRRYGIPWRPRPDPLGHIRPPHHLYFVEHSSDHSLCKRADVALVRAGWTLRTRLVLGNFISPLWSSVITLESIYWTIPGPSQACQSLQK